MPCWDGLLRLEEGGLSISELVYMLTQHYFGMGMLLWHWDGYFTCFCWFRSEETDNEEHNGAQEQP